MKYVPQSVELINQGEGIQGIYNIIAECAATCYKSEAKTGKNAEDFVNKLRSNGHGAMLEFGTVYFTIPIDDIEEDDSLRSVVKYEFIGNPHTEIVVRNDAYYITDNFRQARFGGYTGEYLNKYITEGTDKHLKRACVRIITSIGIARELTRHRAFSFAQESTRYCNYSKNKFGNELVSIDPKPENFDNNSVLLAEYKRNLSIIEGCYLRLTSHGVPAQIARDVLPLGLKTEICMCGFISDWIHFFDLRLRETTGKAHPEMKELAQMIHDKFEEQNLVL